MLVMGCDGGSKGGHRASWEPVSGEESRERELGKMCPGPGPAGKGEWRSKRQSEGAGLASPTSWDMASESHQRLCR